VSIFGPSLADLTLDDVQSYLDRSDDEPLLWEAKGTKPEKGEVRRQVCAFANSHEGGYLILGAERAVGDDGERRWALDGMPFPDEPRLWLTNVITDLTVGVRPRPDFDVAVIDAPNGHVAVVAVTPTSTPPGLANGTVYERLPGKTETVRDPQRLADLYARGDAAHSGARAAADQAARAVLIDWLDGDAGRFRPALDAVSRCRCRGGRGGA
jgi:predicted HTH transcriptional regulator